MINENIIFLRKKRHPMKFTLNDNIIFLNDIKTYSIELLEYVKYNFINDEIIKEIVIYLESSLSEIDNINNYILELESKINELEQTSLF